jgi:hypothetical protein
LSLDGGPAIPSRVAAAYNRSLRIGMIVVALNENQVIIEFIRVGAYVKVSAVDPVTRVEVSIVGNPASGEATLKRTALRKLRYVLEKRNK